MFKNFKSFLQEAEGQEGAETKGMQDSTITGSDPALVKFKNTVEGLKVECEALLSHISMLDVADQATDPNKQKQAASVALSNIKKSQNEIQKALAQIKQGFAAAFAEGGNIKSGQNESAMEMYNGPGERTKKAGNAIDALVKQLKSAKTSEEMERIQRKIDIAISKFVTTSSEEHDEYEEEI